MLIVDMPMPKNCKECPAKEWGGACAITKQFEMCEGIPSWCPIKGEIARCGECRYYKAFDDGTYGHCIISNASMMKDWYCRHGKRKDGAE